VMMVIGGGQGTFIGPILGAILFTAIPELLRVFGNARMAIYALVVIFFVIFMPKGILFYLSKLFKGDRKKNNDPRDADVEKGKGSVS
jgi:ABC-type branched-subunit amino acid transport system permease subunit